MGLIFVVAALLIYARVIFSSACLFKAHLDKERLNEKLDSSISSSRNELGYDQNANPNHQEDLDLV